MEHATPILDNCGVVSRIFLLYYFFTSFIMAQASSDGTIVPFSSVLPACASNCGTLFDVQGKCVPPVTKMVDNKCFCLDNRLKPFQSGNTGVSSVCGATSCTSETDLETIRKWYSKFCANAGINSENGDDTVSTSGGHTSTNKSWIIGHARWVAMLVIIFILITGSWIAACVYRRRYLRRKEKNTEMTDPIAWGPHQMQGATGGYSQSVSINEKSRPTSKVLHNTTINTSPTPTGTRTPIKKT